VHPEEQHAAGAHAAQDVVGNDGRVVGPFVGGRRSPAMRARPAGGGVLARVVELGPIDHEHDLRHAARGNAFFIVGGFHDRVSDMRAAFKRGPASRRGGDQSAIGQLPRRAVVERHLELVGEARDDPRRGVPGALLAIDPHGRVEPLALVIRQRDDHAQDFVAGAGKLPEHQRTGDGRTAKDDLPVGIGLDPERQLLATRRGGLRALAGELVGRERKANADGKLNHGGSDRTKAERASNRHSDNRREKRHLRSDPVNACQRGGLDDHPALARRFGIGKRTKDHGRRHERVTNLARIAKITPHRAHRRDFLEVCCDKIGGRLETGSPQVAKCGEFAAIAANAFNRIKAGDGADGVEGERAI